MTEETNDLTIRLISGPEELDLFNQIPYVLNKEVAGDLAAGRRHTQWIWMAFRDDRLVARVAWWALAGRTEPMVMDIFDFATRRWRGRSNVPVSSTSSGRSI